MSFMRQTSAFVKFVVVLSAFVAVSVHAENADQPAEKQEIHAWLKKVQSAAQRLNYSGTFIYQQGSQIRTSRITHFLDGRNEIEKLEILDGSPREYIRTNDEVVCYMPEIKTLLIEKRLTNDAFPAILAANLTDLAEVYQIRKGQTERVSGMESQIIDLYPKDNLRYGYRLWAERATGLLLRAQTLNDKHDVVEQIAFTQISIGNIDRSRVKPSFHNTGNWQVENAAMNQVNLSGWTVKSLPAGFRKVREVKRVVADASRNGAADDPATKREVLQIVYSDGLAAISVFIEPGRQSRTEGSIQQGATHIVGKRQGDFWLTIVGEVPPAAIRQVANSLELKTR